MQHNIGLIERTQGLDKVQKTTATQKPHFPIKPMLLCACYMGDSEGVFVIALTIEGGLNFIRQ